MGCRGGKVGLVANSAKLVDLDTTDDFQACQLGRF